MDLKERKKKDHLSSFKLCSQLAAKDKNHKRSLFFFSFQFYVLLVLAGWILHEERRFKGNRLVCKGFGGMLAERKERLFLMCQAKESL